MVVHDGVNGAAGRDANIADARWKDAGKQIWSRVHHEQGGCSTTDSPQVPGNELLSAASAAFTLAISFRTE